MPRASGFVLVNALILVLALSTLAAGLLGLAAHGRARIGDVRAADQIALYHDGMSALIPILLENSWEKDGTDHLGEVWATENYAAPIGRGSVVANLSDLQGRLNLNDLLYAKDRARAELERLFETLGLDNQLLDAVVEFLSEEGPANAGLYRKRTVPALPRGGRIAVVEELLQIEGMSEADFLRLKPFVAALPFGTPVNANTAPARVLRAVLPGLDDSGATALIRERTREPFASPLDFRLRAAKMFGDDAFTEVPLERTSVNSSHFEAELEVRLDGRTLLRTVRFFRDDENDGRTRRTLEHAALDSLAEPPVNPELRP